MSSGWPPGAPQPELSGAEAEVVRATNRERLKRGLQPLDIEPTLALIARRHSRDMLQGRYFDHLDGKGRTPAQRVAGQHRRLIGLSAENIWKSWALPTGDPVKLARRMVGDWMASSGHRENILRPDVTHIGMGLARQGLHMRATQVLVQVRALTREPVPVRLSRGAAFPISLLPYPRSAGPAVGYDFLDSREGRPVGRPQAISEGQGSAPGESGLFRLRFYFPEEGHLHIYPGPLVRIGPG